MAWAFQILLIDPKDWCLSLSGMTFDEVRR